MPSGDRTGPSGQGPRTGRALGFCSGYDTPGYSKGFGNAKGRGYGFGGGRGYGFGSGMGRGMGYGRGRNFSVSHADLFQGGPWAQALNKDDEIKLLKAQAEALKQRQQDLEKRLNELQKGSGQ